MTQIELLKRHFSMRSSITNIEAQNLYRIRALPRRISDMEATGKFKFNRLHKTDVTGQRYVRYAIVRD